MRKANVRPLMIALPAFVLGGLVTATLTTTARAQDQTPAERRDARTAEWEYRDYICHLNEECVNDGGKGAYEELNRLGAYGWEAYAYSGKTATGFGWELKRRR